MEQQKHSKHLEISGTWLNCLTMHGTVWTCLEQSGNVWNNLDEFGKDVRSQTYVEQASGHVRKCVEKNHELFGQVLECLENVETILKRFEMSGKAWGCLNMSASARTSLGEYGTLMRNLEKCIDNLGRKVREGMGSCGHVKHKRGRFRKGTQSLEIRMV